MKTLRKTLRKLINYILVWGVIAKLNEVASSLIALIAFSIDGSS